MQTVEKSRKQFIYMLSGKKHHNPHFFPFSSRCWLSCPRSSFCCSPLSAAGDTGCYSRSGCPLAYEDLYCHYR